MRVLLTSTVTEVIGQSLTITPTSTETMPPVLASTPVPTPTTIPYLSWAEDIRGNRFYIGKYRGNWSPNSTELLLISQTVPWEDRVVIKKASPPYFDAVTLAFKDENYGIDATWSPDGEYILFNGPYPEVPPYKQGYVSVWMMDKAGENLHSLQPDRPANYRQWFYGDFLGWLDNHTFVYRFGSGSGFAQIEGFDILTSSTVFVENVSSGVLPPHGQYVPFIAFGGTRVLDLKYYNPELEQHDPPYIRYPQHNGAYLAGIFQDWLPNSNEMLILITRYDIERVMPPLELVIWELDSDELVFVLPNAISASVSGDGATIAYLSLGEATLDHAGKPMEFEYSLDARDLPRYVQLFDLASQTVTYSAPILTQTDPYEDESAYSDDYLYHTAYMAFSPDGQYFAFLTPASILKVIATKNQAELFTIPSINAKNLKNSGNVSYGGELLAWSPDSQKLIYRDESGNPTVLYVETGTQLALTSTGGLRVDSASWSFDSQYLLVSYYDSYEDPPIWLLPESAVIRVP
jgi:hypothetical protein